MGVPGGAPPQDDGTPRRVPGGSVTLTQTEIRDTFNVPDWHPGDHPPLPEVVAHGRRPDLCARHAIVITCSTPS